MTRGAEFGIDDIRRDPGLLRLAYTLVCTEIYYYAEVLKKEEYGLALTQTC